MDTRDIEVFGGEDFSLEVLPGLKPVGIEFLPELRYQPPVFVRRFDPKSMSPLFKNTTALLRFRVCYVAPEEIDAYNSRGNQVRASSNDGSLRYHIEGHTLRIRNIRENVDQH